ncbi:MAG: potassium channel family protein, partial [Bacteroidota bacterium]
IDFTVRFYRAPSKLKFMKWGWIDLISSIPTLDMLRAGRALRLIRLLRVLRAFRSVRHIIHHVYKRRSQGAFTTVATIAVLMVLFSSIAILQVEKDPNSNIKTAEDALWWSYVTVTTVGYGDKYPVTTEGRLIAALLMTTGVGLFGTFTGFLASWFVEDRRREED